MRKVREREKDQTERSEGSKLLFQSLSLGIASPVSKQEDWNGQGMRSVQGRILRAGLPRLAEVLRHEVHGYRFAVHV